MSYAVLGGACFALFLWLTLAVMAGQTEAWDIRLMLALGQERRPWLTTWMKLLSLAGGGIVEVPVTLLLIVGLARRGEKARARWYTGAVLTGWALYGLAKLAVRRRRPHVITHLMHGAGWYSYPSGHSMLAPLIFGLGAVAWAGPWRSAAARLGMLALAAFLAIAIGFSRVYLGAHYPTDVVGGLLLGTGWSALCLLWWERREKAVSRRRPAPLPDPREPAGR